MLWARMLSYVTGTVNQELLLRNEYLGAKNRILRRQIKGRLLLSEGEKATLAEIAQRLGRKALEELAAVAKPDTLLAWYRKLIANKFDGSKFRQQVGRPRIDEEAERLVLQTAKENPRWGYDRIVGPWANLGFLLSDQTVGNILRRHGVSPAPKRKQAICWKDFIRSHGSSGRDRFFHCGSAYPERVSYLLCSVFHSPGESAGELGRNDALPGPRVDGTASTKCNHGGVGISERLPILVA
jgi:hypothetical protein